VIDRNVPRDFYALLNAAKLGRRRCHDLRHACVTRLGEQGVDDKTIAEIVGHSDVRRTKDVYLHAQNRSWQAWKRLEDYSGAGGSLRGSPNWITTY
jgi:integrase